MTWQQLYVAIAMVIQLVFGIWGPARDKEMSQATAVVSVFLRVLLSAIMVCVLHSGGFW